MVNITIPPEKRIRFFVYIIESPNAPDIYHNRFEGDMLKKALSLDIIPCSHRIAVNKEAFCAAINIGLDEQIKQYNNLTPVIHISAHGSKDGIQLTSGEVIAWQELKDLLMPLNKFLQGSLMLCMSSCEGFYACRMAMSLESEEFPFFAVIGHKGKPSWSDTAIAYAAFYHLIRKGCYVVDTVKAMREASGDNDFLEITAKRARQIFIDIINQQQIDSTLQAKLKLENKNTFLSQDAVNLEKSKPNF